MPRKEVTSRGFTRRDIFKLGGALGTSLAGSSLLAGCSLAASTQQQATGQKRRVTLVTHDLNPFFVPVLAGFEEFARLRGWQTQFLGPAKHDVQATVELQANAISSRPDALGLTRIDTTSFNDNIKRAQSQGIVVVLYNTASAGYKDLGLAYVGQEFISAGRVNGLQAAKRAHQITGRKEGLIVMGTIAPGHSALEQRMQGTTEGVNSYNTQNGTSFFTEKLTTSTEQAEAISRIEAKWSKDKDKIVGWAHADFVHWFTGIWIQDRGLKGKMANGGFDLVPGVLEAIKNGTAQWSIGQNPYAQGWITSALIDMRLEAGYPPFDYDTGAEVVDSSNIDAIIKREQRFSKKPLPKPVG